MSDCFKLDRNIIKNIRMFSFKDDEQIYTNGSDLVPFFRVDQILDVMGVQKLLDRDKAQPMLISDAVPSGIVCTCGVLHPLNAIRENLVFCPRCGQRIGWPYEK